MTTWNCEEEDFQPKSAGFADRTSGRDRDWSVGSEDPTRDEITSAPFLVPRQESELRRGA